LGFSGEAEPELDGRQLQHDRGKTLGGSSSINGMCFIRGNALDYEGWRQAGCEGWSYSDVLPYFKRMESYSGGADEFRGTEGPLHVQRSEATNHWRVRSWRQAHRRDIKQPMISAVIAKKVLVFLTERFSRASVGARRGLTWILRVGAKT
jgi:choline dehydrogenase-like flavoprotein